MEPAMREDCRVLRRSLPQHSPSPTGAPWGQPGMLWSCLIHQLWAFARHGIEMANGPIPPNGPMPPNGPSSGKPWNPPLPEAKKNPPNWGSLMGAAR